MDNLIVVTGYGQFAGHEINASGEAVKLLPDEIEVDLQKYPIKKLEVEVTYTDVDKTVELIWSLKPKLVIHCGVHGGANKIKLENCSINDFCRQDFKGKLLPDPVVCLENSGKCSRLETKLKVGAIVQQLNETYKPMFETSCDVGNYLCGYIYLKSLDIDSRRTLFVHVPRINQPYTTRETTDGIIKIIELCVKDLNEPCSCEPSS